MLYTNRFRIWDIIVNQLWSRKNGIWGKVDPIGTSYRLMGRKSLDRQQLITRLQRSLGVLTAVDPSVIPDFEKKAILDYADRTLNHEFNYLGSGWKTIDPLDWHTDFLSGHRWEPGRFYKEYRCKAPDGGFDVKTVWELSRNHHLLWLAEAYALTREQRYAEKVVAIINDWMGANPLMRSINWTCSMDAAIRAVNMMYAVGIISDSEALTDSFSQAFSRSLYEHGFHIANNLEKTIPNSGNHYLSDLVGLLFIFSVFPDNRFAGKCFEFALKEFYREAKTELSPDGTDYEHSVSYHRLVAELFVFTYPLLKRIGIDVPDDVTDRLVKAIDYVAAYTKPSGFAPLIGDNDNGRFLPFVPRDFRKHSYLLTVGETLFGREYRTCPECCGESLYLSSDIMAGTLASYETADALLFPDNKTAIAKVGPAHLIVTNSAFALNRCTNAGESGGTHTHPDSLSFDLNVHGIDFLADPGAYVYTSDPAMRNRFRSTGSHNTVTVDGCNTSDFIDGDVFTQVNRTENHFLSIEERKDQTRIEGSYDFLGENLTYTHTREFILASTALEIRDEIVCRGEHTVAVHFQTVPGCRVVDDAMGLHIVNEGLALNIVSSGNDSILPVCISHSFFSPAYGELEPAEKMSFEHRFRDSVIIKTVLSWKNR